MGGPRTLAKWPCCQNSAWSLVCVQCLRVGRRLIYPRLFRLGRLPGTLCLIVAHVSACFGEPRATSMAVRPVPSAGVVARMVLVIASGNLRALSLGTPLTLERAVLLTCRRSLELRRCRAKVCKSLPRRHQSQRLDPQVMVTRVSMTPWKKADLDQ